MTEEPIRLCPYCGRFHRASEPCPVLPIHERGDVSMPDKPPLGKIPWLPPRSWCEDHIGDRYSGDPCKNCVPCGGPHDYVLPTATLAELRAFWRRYLQGMCDAQ